MVSRENLVILLCATAGLILATGGRVLTDLNDTVLIGLLVVVGVVTPQLLNGYLDTRESE
jgi:hypothetical protein